MQVFSVKHAYTVKNQIHISAIISSYHNAYPRILKEINNTLALLVVDLETYKCVI
jgi:hypothetical protein